MTDWKIGDLAMCIREPRGDVTAAWEPAVGGVYTVAAFYPAFEDEPAGLDLEEDPDKFDPESDWEADAFRKIHPHTPDAEDIETIALLNEMEPMT